MSRSTTAPTYITRDLGREVLLPRTLPVRTIDDLTPYHWVLSENNNLSLRKGRPPKKVAQAVAHLTDGTLTLNDFLDEIGVPK